MDPTNPYVLPEFPNVEPRSPPLADPESNPVIRFSVRTAIVGVYGFFGFSLTCIFLQDIPFLLDFLGDSAEKCIAILSLIMGLSLSFFAGWYRWTFGVRFQFLRRHQDAENKQ